jgi:hypothetical protein
MISFWYSVDPSPTRYEIPIVLSTTSPLATKEEAYLCALAAAQDLHDNHDGWEGGWPMVFRFYNDETGPVVRKFEIDREARPSFVPVEQRLG